MSRKPLIFAPPYPLILFTGGKIKTFKVTGAENYNVGDEISLCYPDLAEFAQALIFQKYEKKFRDLTEEDWRGHERFASDEEMYKIYSAWGGFQVRPDTGLTVLGYCNFRLTGPPRIGVHAQSSPKGTVTNNPVVRCARELKGFGEAINSIDAKRPLPRNLLGV
jgi:hypothetical protein